MSEWTDSEGNPLGEWVEITREEYNRVFGDGSGLTVFSSLTDPSGVYGPPEIYTAWGLRGEDAPLIDIRDYKDDEGKTTRQVCRKFVPHAVSSPVVDQDRIEQLVEIAEEYMIRRDIVHPNEFAPPSDDEENSGGGQDLRYVIETAFVATAPFLTGPAPGQVTVDADEAAALLTRVRDPFHQSAELRSACDRLRAALEGGEA